MAVNTTTFESTLQTKLNNTSLEAKEMLLLGKALESTVGSIAVSDINTAGATKVSEINAVATNTFKTVGGTSILGSGDIATLPSQTGASGKVLKSDGTNATWGTDVEGKLLKVQSYEDRVDRSHGNNTPTDSGLLFSFTPTLATSKLIFMFSVAFSSGDGSQYTGGRVLIGGVVRASTMYGSGQSYSNRGEDPYTKTIEHQCTSTAPVSMQVQLYTNDNISYMNTSPAQSVAFTTDFVTTCTVFEIGA